MNEVRAWIDRLAQSRNLEQETFAALLKALFKEGAEEDREYLFLKAREVRHQIYGKQIFIRGLVEITNRCKNDCYYCGIRKSNSHISRYRLTQDQILECCREGYRLGFRTFVLQGGEDPGFSDAMLADLITAIKGSYPDCAVTLSLGEKGRETYQRFFDAGADRYLLRHETANDAHYRRLHPPELLLSRRKQCLEDLKAIGYQVGCGCMIGSPYQTAEHLAEDLVYMKELEPQMVGLGPFLPQKDTPFGGEPEGSLVQTLVMLGIVRLMLPQVLLPATTALGTIHPHGREMGIRAGANVVMPNLSPLQNRKKYLLYDHKLGTGEESGEGLELLKKQMNKIGYQVVVSRGDWGL